VDCVVEKEYVYNNRFKCIKGEQYWHDGHLEFPAGKQKEDGTYRTFFGPAPMHNGVIYANTDRNLALAIRRLTAVRKPEIPGYHELLYRNQAKFIYEHKDWLLGMRERYTPYFSDWVSARMEAEAHHADPHPKRELRIQAWRELVETAHANDPDHTWEITKNWWKLKLNEWAKSGKYPRTIVDLFTPASLLGFKLCERMKIAMAAEKIHINGGDIWFIKSPEPGIMKEAFEMLYNPPGRFFFCYFSDDSVLAIRDKNGKVHWYCLDIVSCDTSHDARLFKAVGWTIPIVALRDWKRVVAQCKSPLKLRSLVDKKVTVVVVPEDPLLKSGVTATGLVNGVADELIPISISECDYVDGESIRAACERVGYIVTGWEQECEVFEDVQFLKHSPVRDRNGGWSAMLNLGCFLRASGTCKGDLPGRGPLKERADAFQSGLLQGAYPRTNCTALDNMRQTYAHVKTPVMSDTFKWKVHDLGVEPTEFNMVDVHHDSRIVNAVDSSIYARYRLDPAEIDYFENVFCRSGFQTFHNHSCLTKILDKDYSGMQTLASEKVQWHGQASREVPPVYTSGY